MCRPLTKSSFNLAVQSLFNSSIKNLVFPVGMTLTLCLVSQYAHSDYVFENQSSETFDTVTTDVNWTDDSSQTDYPTDDDYELVNIGFTFYLGETAYTQVRILANGALHFGTDQGFHKDYTNESLPITSFISGAGFEEAADRAILGYWDDLEPSTNGTVRYDTLGSGTNRRFVASWENVPEYGDSSTNYSFQIVLYENGQVRFRYGNGDADGTNATVGIEVDDSDYTQYSYNSNSISGAVDILWTREFPSLSSVSASCNDTDTVSVTFASDVTPARAIDVTNYNIDNSVTISAATLISSNVVELTTSTLSTGTTYTLSTSIPNQSTTFVLGALTTETFADQFSSTSYSNSTGSSAWSSNWTEIADDGTASGGNVTISSGELLLDDRPNTGGEPSIYREVDLSGFTSATLTFDFDTPNNLENGDRFDILMSNNGGTSYTVIDNFRNDVSGAASYDISAYIASNTRIRFTVENGFSGFNERMEIDNVVITGTKIESCSSSIDHFEIIHDGSGLTCEAENITIRACADTSCTLSTDSVSLDFLTDGSTYSSPSFTGSTNISLVQTTADVLTLSIANPSISATNSLVCDSGGGGTSCDITFVNTGFKFYGDGIADDIGNQIAGKISNVAPSNQTITIRAIQSDPATGQCDALINNATQTIGFAYQCNDPSSCAIANNGMSINGSQTIDDINSGYSNISVSFDGTGTGSLNFSYDDVGEIAILANASLAIDGSNVPVQGASNSFIVRPFAYDIQITGDPNATSATDAVFAVAGNSFATSLRSVLWESGDDTNNDGVPDSGADLSDNSSTPNIDNITGTINLSPSPQVVLSSGALGTTSVNFGSFTSGSVDVTQSWSEVGIMTINASTPIFMSSGGSVTGSRTNIGRFIPDHFVMTAPVITDQCGSFTYAGFFDGVNVGLDKNGQTFDVSGTITAENSSNVTTQNYTGAFAKLTIANITIQPYDTNASANANGRVNFAPDALNFVSGAASFSDSTTDFQYASLAAPFDLRLDLSATDSDSVSSGTVSSNSSEQRIGRMRLADSYGSEIADLELRVFSDYYDGTAWTLNTGDSCSTYISSNVSFDVTSFTDQLNNGETNIFAPTTSQTLSSGNSDFSNGFWFSAPGDGNFGSVKIDLNLTSQPWLRFDWDSDNNLEDTNARLHFGYYRGSDRVIYWKEIRN
ncbi:MAG: DUF6701 domain-containing protein [Kangiellaceae bacterium]